MKTLVFHVVPLSTVLRNRTQHDVMVAVKEGNVLQQVYTCSRDTLQATVDQAADNPAYIVSVSEKALRDGRYNRVTPTHNVFFQISRGRALQVTSKAHSLKSW